MFDLCIYLTLQADEEESPSSKPIVIKAKGKVADLVALCDEEMEGLQINEDVTVDCHAGIAHTRWATHGPPCAKNSHPHVSSSNHEFVLVHNGTITNYRALKEFLIKEGEEFMTETDTEVIPKLCNFLYSKLPEPIPFPQLVCEVVKQLEGAYALLIKSSVYPGELVACRRGSPLILGVKYGIHAEQAPKSPVSPNTPLTPKLTGSSASAPHSTGDPNKVETQGLELFLASEASAVVEHTKQVIYLEDNDIVHMRDGEYTVYNWSDIDSASVEVRRTAQTLTMEVSQIMKGGYDYYMQKEIFEQADTIAQTMQGRIKATPMSPIKFGVPNVDRLLYPRVRLGGLVDYVSTIRRSRRIIFIACGTSYHAALCSRQTVEELTQMPVVLELAGDILDRRCPIFRDDTCIFVSQSGETADTMRAMEYAIERGALCVGITNTVGSAIARKSTCGIHINAGAEIGVASTKAYTSQIVAITMMAIVLASDQISKRKRTDEIVDSLLELPDNIRQCLLLDEKIKKLAENLRDENSLLVFGRGRNYATAVEAALKVKEVSYMHSEGINAGEMKHGPLALVDEHMPIIVVATMDEMHNKMQGVIQQLMARNARLIIVCNEEDIDMEDMIGARYPLIKVPKGDGALQPVLNIIPLQLLSYHLTLLRGFNVDQPRNLAKSVTVTEE
jgi:glucosamine--fructose-6-phosphate aminotransferase (isomerizing)